MQHHKAECHAEKLVLCVQCQGHSEGLYVFVSIVGSEDNSFSLYLLNVCNKCKDG